ncbi:MAG: ferredoxin [Candidatus Bathyarchaeota archaeon]|nr:ferredoxin [Candidatus Bathyarchaeota archaeon]
MGKPKAYVSFDYAKCPPCSGTVCVGVCPLGVLEVGSDGKPHVADAAECTVCGVCADLCPCKAIAIVHNEELCQK